MNAAATAFAQPPERRRCGRFFRAARLARACNESDRPPISAAANAKDHQTPIRIDFATAPPFASRSRRDPDRSAKGGIA